MSLPVLKRVHAKSKSILTPTKLTERQRSQKNFPVEQFNLRLKNEQIAQDHRNIKIISNYIQSKIIPRNNLRSDSPFHKRIQTELNKDPVLGHFLQPSKILITSCNKWVIYERRLEKYERGFRTQQPHKMQGLTKLLTFYCTYVIVTKYELQLNKFQCIGTASIQELPHSLTQIKKDDMITLEPLLNIMILQESIQAQYCLAVNLGMFIYKEQAKKHLTMFDITRKNQMKFIEIFIRFMNTTAGILKLHKTTIRDVGVNTSLSLNKSCANDIAKLSIECLKIQWMAEIFQKDTYLSYLKYIDEDGELMNRPISVAGWQHNKYLQYRYVCRSSKQEFGQTSCSIIYETEKASVVIVLLGCHSSEEREQDIQISVEYFLKKKGLLEPRSDKEEQK